MDGQSAIPMVTGHRRLRVAVDVISLLSSGQEDRSCMHCPGQVNPSGLSFVEHQTPTRPVQTENNLVKGHGDNCRISENLTLNGIQPQNIKAVCCIFKTILK